MKALIVYDSVFGNTKAIAEAVAKAFKKTEVNVVKVSDASASLVKEADILIVGSPTRAMSPIPSIKAWLKSLDREVVKGKSAAAFDTRMDAEELNSKVYSFFEGIMGHAVETIEKSLKHKGAVIAIPGGGFIVKESEGPLRAGETERAVEWAKGIK